MIDDDEDDLEMLSSELEKKGIKVKTFDSSAKALLYLILIPTTDALPALIIMDYNMPNKNGQEVLLILKENNGTKDIPVIFVSASHSLTDRFMAMGANVDFLAKPFDINELIDKVALSLSAA